MQVTYALLVIVERQLDMKFMKTVPTIEQSGIYAKLPLPYFEIPSKSLVSNSYPYPKTWIFGVRSSSMSMYFLRVGMIPRGGFKLGSPSVSKSVYTFLFLWLIFFYSSKDILRPSQIFVVPAPYNS